MNFEIKLTKEQEIFQTERWSDSDFSYSLPVQGEGKYVLILKFSEVYFNSPNEKVFNVAIGQETILKEVDIFAKIGKISALNEYVELEVKNGKLFYKGRAIDENGWDASTKTMKLKFVKLEKDNPKINGIVLVKGGIEDTDKKEYLDSIEKMEKVKLEREKKQREFQRMSKTIDYEDFENDFVDDGKTFNVNSGLFSGTSIIIYVILGGIAYVVLFGKSKK